MTWFKCTTAIFKTEYLLDVSELIANTYISATNGSEVSYQNWSSTPFIEVNGGETLKLASASAWDNTGYSAWYDSNKQFISNFSAASSSGYSSLSVPSTAYYMRLSAKSADLQKTMVWRDCL